MIQLFFFLHIGAAIVAFGPTFVFPLIGAMGGKEPMHANFAARISGAIERRVVLPVALTMPLSGIGLIWTLPIDVLAPTSRWLLLGIAVYIVAIAYVVFVQDPAAHKVIALSTPPAGGPPPGGPPPGGPPPELLAAIKKVQQGGLILTVLLVAIFLLMIFRPGS
ncbi:MAG: DUF2269 family protein [Candidatus Limnocylindrales bacterium]